jgi:DNA-binding NarL/FixJ family response regulator
MRAGSCPLYFGAALAERCGQGPMAAATGHLQPMDMPISGTAVYSGLHGPAGGEPSGRAAIRVLLVEDHPVVRKSLRRLLDARADLVVGAAVGSAREALAEAGARPFDVAVVDYHLRGGDDGLSLTRALKAVSSPPRVLIYSAYADAPLTIGAIAAGADGLLSKNGLGSDLYHAIGAVATGRRVLPAIPRALLADIGARLQPDDRCLLAVLVAGREDDAVAEALQISEQELAHRRRSLLHALTGPPGAARLPWDDAPVA